MNASTIRCDSDLSLFEKLKTHKDVIRVNEELQRMQEKGGMNIRRHLLATSVRLSERMAADVHTMAKECGDLLGLEIPLELYVFSSPQFNAACFKPEDGRLFIMFSSSLLEAFSGNELKFVIGHELGHHVYRHHDIPIGYLLKGKRAPDPRLALDLFSWSRYAEISADRAGAHCAKDLQSVARSLFKLASGLSGKTISFSLEDFLNQVDEMQLSDAEPGQGAPKEDWFSTHPFSPLRVKALSLFDESKLARDNGKDKETLEVEVQSLMSLMEPSYLEGRTKTSEAMRRALFAAAMAVAAADGEISDSEKEIFEQFFGSGTLTDSLSVDKLREELPGRLALVKEIASIPQRMQLLRDLCLIANAEDQTGPLERAVLDEVADALDVPRGFICKSLDRDVELD